MILIHTNEVQENKKVDHNEAIPDVRMVSKRIKVTSTIIHKIIIGF